MKQSTIAYYVLTVFWVLYAVAGSWVLLQEASQVQRDLLLIVGGFTILASIATAAVLSRDDFTDRD